MLLYDSELITKIPVVMTLELLSFKFRNNDKLISFSVLHLCIQCLQSNFVVDNRMCFFPFLCEISPVFPPMSSHDFFVVLKTSEHVKEGMP